MFSHRLVTKSFTIGLAAAALGASSAPALTPREQQYIASHGQGAPVPQVVLPSAEPPVRAAADGGFDWGSAAIGAGAVGGLSIVVALGAFGLSDGRRVRVAR